MNEAFLESRSSASEPAPADRAGAAAAPTLTSLLALRAERSPDQLGYAFLPDGLREAGRITWAQLHERSLALAAQLATLVPPGGRALLLLDPGLDVVVAAHACFAARVVGVPVAPPNPRRRAEGLADIGRVMADADIAAVISTTAVASGLRPEPGLAPALRTRPWLCVDEAPAAAPSTTLPAPVATDLAYLQYTSGSTSAPRGVMLTHEQFLSNLAAQRDHWGVHGETTVYSWLPPWHDMGLVAGILTGLFNGVPTHLAPPAAIGRRPLGWLQAISDLGITMSGAPDFMFRMCAAKATPDFVAGLDLSRWERAFCGAEPVRASTMQAFAETFAPAGFRADALSPSYGLAEATLLVTANAPEAAPTIRSFDRTLLSLGTARPTSAGTPLVGSGAVVAGHAIAIVDPDSRRRLAAGQVGELWTSGPSTGAGYWRAPEPTDHTFGATITGEDEVPWLRTGDLAFVDGGELFISGRRKDVVIANGVNHHAIDVELVAQESHSLLLTRATAVFATDDGVAERLVVVVEAPSAPLTGDDAADVLAAVRRAVGRAFDLMPDRIVLVRPGAIPKTTSGKVQRGLTRTALAADQLPISWEWSATRASPA